MTGDGWRVYTLIKAQADPSHPYSRFTIGSLETLNRSDIHSQLVDYYSARYTARAMKLVVLGREAAPILRELSARLGWWALKHVVCLCEYYYELEDFLVLCLPTQARVSSTRFARSTRRRMCTRPRSLTARTPMSSSRACSGPVAGNRLPVNILVLSFNSWVVYRGSVPVCIQKFLYYLI